MIDYGFYGDIDTYNLHYRYVEGMAEKYLRFRIHIKLSIKLPEYTSFIERVIYHKYYISLVQRGAFDDEYYEFFINVFEEFYEAYSRGTRYPILDQDRWLNL